MGTIDSPKDALESESDYQKISFALGQLGLSFNQTSLSPKTRELLLQSVIEDKTGNYSLDRTFDSAIYDNIHQDELLAELLGAKSIPQRTELLLMLQSN